MLLVWSILHLPVIEVENARALAKLDERLRRLKRCALARVASVLDAGRLVWIWNRATKTCLTPMGSWTRSKLFH